MTVGTITYKTGDLLQASEEAIAHGCNTHGVMGAGVARLVRQKYPEAFFAYREACLSHRFFVGTAQDVVDANVEKVIFNLGTQKAPGPDATPWGIFLSFANMGESLIGLNLYEVAIPRIGAGIGGLHWETQVVPAIQEAQLRCSRTFNVVVYDLPSSTN
jgi:O-acetyl-ADP-ribose deacetylase (regulator of RNase III)